MPSKILIVDDEPFNLDLLEQELTDLGYAVARADDGAQALSEIEQVAPDLVLLDYLMPRMNGFEVLQWVRSQPQLAALQVVVLSSSDEIRDINRAYQLGANSFLVKPLSFDEFVGMLEALRSYCLRVSQTVGRQRALEPAGVATV